VINSSKRLIVVAAAFLCFLPGAAAAQDVAAGVKGGFNMSTIAFDPSDIEWNVKFGAVGGGFVALPVGSWLTIQPEGLLSRKGGTAKLDNTEASIGITYLEVPVLAKVGVAGSGGRKFSIFGGPSMAFKLASDSSATVGGEEVEVDIDEDVEDFDFGIVGGLEYAIGRFSIDARYTFSLTDLNGAEDDDTKAKNRVLSVMAGWKF
jgi:hypothetical protein